MLGRAAPAVTNPTHRKAVIRAQTLYQRAVSELGLNVPIARMEQADGWDPEVAPVQRQNHRVDPRLRTAPTRRHTDPHIEPVPDNLTAISGIGPATARLLHEAGYTTFDLLATADPADLDRLLNLTARRAIRDRLAPSPTRRPTMTEDKKPFRPTIPASQRQQLYSAILSLIGVLLGILLTPRRPGCQLLPRHRPHRTRPHHCPCLRRDRDARGRPTSSHTGDIDRAITVTPPSDPSDDGDSRPRRSGHRRSDQPGRRHRTHRPPLRRLYRRHLRR